MEVSFSPDEFIVSKTDKRGIITYANNVFLRVAQYSEEELIGKPHNIIRHPEMPKCAFKLVWDTIQSGKEIFAYVLNLTKRGDHYWVLAHITPSFDADGAIIAFHSNRRKPSRKAIEAIQPVYETLCAEEAKHNSVPEAMKASTNVLLSVLESKGVSYDEFILSI